MEQELNQLVQAILIASDPSQGPLHNQALEYLSTVQQNSEATRDRGRTGFPLRIFLSCFPRFLLRFRDLVLDFLSLMRSITLAGL